MSDTEPRAAQSLGEPLPGDAPLNADGVAGGAPGSGVPVDAGGGNPVRPTRTSATFNGLLAATLVLILLLIFILENTQSVKISFLGLGGHVPLGVALLIAAVAGGLLLGLVGGARILQLRHRTKRVK